MDDTYAPGLLRGDPRCFRGELPEHLCAALASVPHDPLAGAIVTTMARVESHFARGAEATLEPFGLSVPKFGVLMALSMAGAPLHMGDLARRLLAPRSNLTGLVDRLERDGLVRRVPDPEDHRATLLEITPLGKERTTAAFPRVAERAHWFVAALSADERLHLAQLLAKLEESLLERTVPVVPDLEAGA